ncbi:MAG: hypothetical protein JRI84_16165 [Deltaproteobacteria bacterium]|nr:hypothetical protein [Deltaproteobacteria bacterium]
MKRRDLIKELTTKGCFLYRHGARHFQFLGWIPPGRIPLGTGRKVFPRRPILGLFFIREGRNMNPEDPVNPV